METLFLGKKQVNLDSKGRIIIPAAFDIKSGTEIAFAKLPGEYYQLYILERINRLVDELMKKRDYTLNEEEYNLIVKKLNTLFDLIVDTTKLDSQRRVIVPSDVRENTSDKILLQGKGDCIALFPNDYTYSKYCEVNLERTFKI